MRPVEVKHLRRRNVDLFNRTVTVARSKNVTSHRVIPLNQGALKALGRMLERADGLGFKHPDHYIWLRVSGADSIRPSQFVSGIRPGGHFVTPLACLG